MKRVEPLRLRWDGKMVMWPGEPVPETWVRCYRLYDRDAEVYAPRWVAPMVRFAHWWQGARWCVERWAVWWDRKQRGCPCSELIREGSYFSTMWFHTGEWSTPRPGMFHAVGCPHRHS